MCAIICESGRHTVSVAPLRSRRPEPEQDKMSLSGTRPEQPCSSRRRAQGLPDTNRRRCLVCRFGWARRITSRVADYPAARLLRLSDVAGLVFPMDRAARTQGDRQPALAFQREGLLTAKPFLWYRPAVRRPAAGACWNRSAAVGNRAGRPAGLCVAYAARRGNVRKHWLARGVTRFAFARSRPT